MATPITMGEAQEFVREPERGASAAKAASICEGTQRLPHFVWPIGMDGTLPKVSQGAGCLRADAVKMPA
jgi:hypothetical protein